MENRRLEDLAWSAWAERQRALNAKQKEAEDAVVKKAPYSLALNAIKDDAAWEKMVPVYRDYVKEITGQDLTPEQQMAFMRADPVTRLQVHRELQTPEFKVIQEHGRGWGTEASHLLEQVYQKNPGPVYRVGDDGVPMQKVGNEWKPLPPPGPYKPPAPAWYNIGGRLYNALHPPVRPGAPGATTPNPNVPGSGVAVAVPEVPVATPGVPRASAPPGGSTLASLNQYRQDYGELERLREVAATPRESMTPEQQSLAAANPNLQGAIARKTLRNLFTASPEEYERRLPFLRGDVLNTPAPAGAGVKGRAMPPEEMGGPVPPAPPEEMFKPRLQAVVPVNDYYQ
jgi:hypothetical protein